MKTPKKKHSKVIYPDRVAELLVEIAKARKSTAAVHGRILDLMDSNMEVTQKDFDYLMGLLHPEWRFLGSNN